MDSTSTLYSRSKQYLLSMSASRYDGLGGWAKNSTRIPLKDAALYVGGTAFTIWSTIGLARFIWG